MTSKEKKGIFSNKNQGETIGGYWLSLQFLFSFLKLKTFFFGKAKYDIASTIRFKLVCVWQVSYFRYDAKGN